MSTNPSTAPNTINDEVSAMISPKVLARALKKTTEEVIYDLKENNERGVFAPQIEAYSVLTWGAVNRACERAGISPEKVMIPFGNSEQGGAPGKSTTKDITDGEWELLKAAASEAAGFHRVYGESVRKFTEKVDPEGAKELLEFHMGRAEAIDSLIKKVEKRKEPAITPTM